ncbi:MAG TPA: DUF4292 domain-containing protein, partial [Bacteroidia bacterium]
VSLRIIFPCLLLALIIASCKSKKTVAKQNLVTTTDTTSEKCRMDFKFGKSLSKRMNDSQLDFTYAAAKFSCQLTLDSEEHSFNVSVRCRKDSVIWLSISKLGIDAARILITKDTVKFTLGLTEKKYFVGDFSYINQMLHADLDYEMLQALLFGNSADFHDEDEKLKPGRDRSTCQYFLSTIRRKHLRRIINGTEVPSESYQTMWLDPETFKITTLEFTDIQTKRKFSSSYSDFKAVGKYLAPFKLLYTITAEKNIKASISYGRININEPQTFPFKIPASYDRIEFKK